MRFGARVAGDGVRLEPRAIDALVAFADAHPEYVICGGRTVTPAGELDPRSCWGAPTLWSLLCSALMLSTLRPGSRVFDPEALGGFRRDLARPVDIVSVPRLATQAQFISTRTSRC